MSNESNSYDRARFVIYLRALSAIRNPWIPNEREKIIGWTNHGTADRVTPESCGNLGACGT